MPDRTVRHPTHEEDPYRASFPRPIGPYTAVRLVGVGGAAAVFEAIHQDTQQTVAIKMLRARSISSDAHRRFQAEFQALSAIRHPRIARVFECGEHQGAPWYAMELINGPTLDRAILAHASGPFLPFPLVKKWITQLADALSEIHAHGWVHRDIHPRNVVVVESGDITLLDFGILKQLGAHEHTANQQILGTAAYMAPEQIAGERVTHQADLYALGAVLFRLLTGKPPFGAETMHGLMNKHLYEQPTPVLRVRPDAPKRLAIATDRLLQKDPDERFNSADHLLLFLRGPSDPVARAESPFLGRAALRGVIERTLRRVQTGHGGQTLVIVGDQGMGKTRALRQVASRAEDAGIAIVPIQAEGSEGSRVSLLEHPALALRHRKECDDAYAEWKQIFQQLLRKAPVLLLVDGLDCLDSASIDLIRFVVHQARDPASESVGFACTAEDRDQDLLLEWSADDGCTMVTLEALSRTEIEEWVLTATGDERLAAAQASAIADATSGRPARVIDAVERLARAEPFLDAAPDVPQELRARFSSLGADAKRVAHIVASMSSPVTPAFLSRVAALDDSATNDALDELDEAGLIDVDHRSTPPTVTTPHRFETLLAKRIHRRIADALADEPPLAMRRGEERALHLEKSGQLDAAFEQHVDFADRWTAEGRIDEASQRVEAALALESGLGEATHPTHHQPLARLRATAARIALHRGDVEQAKEWLKDAKRLAPQSDVPEVALSRAIVALRQGQPHRAIGALDCLLPSNADPGIARCEAHHLRAEAYMALGDIAQATQSWLSCMDEGKEIGHSSSTLRGQFGVAMTMFAKGNTTIARHRLEVLLPRLLDAGLYEEGTHARYRLLDITFGLGLWSQTLSISQDLEKDAFDRQDLRGQAMALVWQANIKAALGERGMAMTLVRAALQLHSPSAPAIDGAALAVAAARLLALNGEYGHTISLLEENQNDRIAQPMHPRSLEAEGLLAFCRGQLPALPFAPEVRREPTAAAQQWCRAHFAYAVAHRAFDKVHAAHHYRAAIAYAERMQYTVYAWLAHLRSAECSHGLPHFEEHVAEGHRLRRVIETRLGRRTAAKLDVWSP